MDDRESRRLARRYVEERIDQIRYALAMCEACGGKSVGDPRVWDMEEELLEELAELEYALATENFDPYVRWALSLEGGWSGC